MYRKIFIEKYLENNFSESEAKSEIDFVLDILFSYSIKNFYLGEMLNNEQIQQVLNIIEERVVTRKPIQKILNTAFFYGRKFYVNEDTLVPRPETEIAVSKTLELVNNFKTPKILDIGTGSGCIPITIALENKSCIVHSVDISKEAIIAARKNLETYNLQEKIKIFESDLFSNVNEKYDIIISNPPYIPIKEKENLQYEVKYFDPALALFAYDDEGVEFYKKIIVNSLEYLNSNGYLIFEIGINQHQKVSDLLSKNGFKNIEVIKDYNKIERVVIANK